MKRITQKAAREFFGVAEAKLLRRLPNVGFFRLESNQDKNPYQLYALFRIDDKIYASDKIACSHREIDLMDAAGHYAIEFLGNQRTYIPVFTDGSLQTKTVIFYDGKQKQLSTIDFEPIKASEGKIWSFHRGAVGFCHTCYKHHDQEPDFTKMYLYKDGQTICVAEKLNFPEIIRNA